jgi:hypothetical protein
LIESILVSRSIRRAVRFGDYVRRPRARLHDASGHKEWFHFCIAADDVHALVNFSVVDDLRGGAAPGAETARVTCIVRTATGWEGDIEEVSSARIFAGRVAADFGASSMRYDGSDFHLRVRLKKRPVAMDLVLRPATIPCQLNNIALGDGPPLHWFLLPHLRATGHVTAGETTYSVQDAPSYHDHNWGYFHWGGDFAWVWGYAHACDASSPWVIALDRLTNRARTIDVRRGLILWKGPRQHRLFGSRDLTVEYEGFMRPETVFKLPRPMALLDPGLASDVPKVVRGAASGLGDSLEFEFSSERVCQILTPNDADLGTTVISEVSGQIRLSGHVHGERVELHGPAMFEFLGG